MANMFDYLNWRGDISFLQVPPTPVDFLIFSTLAYIDFTSFVPETPDQSVSMAAVADALAVLPDAESRLRKKMDLTLLLESANSKRFSSIRLTFYQSKLLHDQENQFAAITFLLPDGSAVLAFRGTDGTLIGWKEDFNMSFQDTVPAQHDALAYLNHFAASFAGPLQLTGHSKGGNLAVFAGAKAVQSVQDRIIAIHNQDGPGFSDYLMGDSGYLRMVPKIHTYLPQSSVVGMLLEHEEPYSIIRSRNVGILQHEPHCWDVLGGDFVHMEEITPDALFVDRTVRSWLASLNRQEREALIDSLFEALFKSGAETVDDLVDPQHIRAFIKYLSANDGTKDIVTKEFFQFLKSAGTAILRQQND